MNGLLPELVLLIGDSLPLRSCCRLSLTCQSFYALLNERVTRRKRDLFKTSVHHYRLQDTYPVFSFTPGPLIKHLPKELPLDGVYFFDGHCLCFFFRDFDGFLNRGNTIGTEFVATINTTKIHAQDLGAVFSHWKLKGTKGSTWESMGFDEYQLCHWNDVDEDYVQMFETGKKVIGNFWAHY